MFANQVKNVRTQLEMSQKKLANALGVSFAIPLIGGKIQEMNRVN
ncbi:MAG: hypothetical protein ACLUAG_07130 [Lachnospiraceae bacterium]